MLAIVFAVIVLIIGFVVAAVLRVKQSDEFTNEHSEWESRKARYERNPNYEREPGEEPKAPKSVSYPIFIGLILAVIFLIASCIVVVPTGYTGILTTFGKVENRTVSAGINFIAPWQKVVKMDNRIQIQEFDSAAFSSDIQEATYSVSINYNIDQETARDIYKTVGVDYYQTVMFPAIQDNIKSVFAKYTAEKLIGNRDILTNEVTQKVADDMAQYGINVVSVAIRDIDFTDTFTNAVEAKQVAAQNKLKAQTEQEQKTMEEEQTAKRAIIAAEAEAEKAKIAANADLEVVKVQADAAKYAGEKEAEMNKRIAESLNNNIIDYYWIKQWDGKLPETVLGGETTGFMIDLTD